MPVVKILSPKSSPGSIALAKIASDVSPVLGVDSNLFWVIARDFLLMALVAAQALSFFTIPIDGHLSDLIGRKRMYIIGSGRPPNAR
jgi:MFS family permease